jgi:hypothetical protein
MELIDAPDGTKAWVCCAESMKRYTERMKRFWNSPQMKCWRETFGDNGRTEN